MSGDGKEREAELLACLRSIVAGQDAWPEFWELTGRIILTELHRLGINLEFERDDILQDIALVLLRDDCRFIREHLEHHQHEPFSAYLRITARHTAINYLRKQKRAVSIEYFDGVPADSLESKSKWGMNPSISLEEQLALKALLEQSTGGRGNQLGYQIMYLRFVERASVNQIAERLRMQPNSVSQRIRYYLQRLRTLYGVALQEHGHDVP